MCWKFSETESFISMSRQNIGSNFPYLDWLQSVQLLQWPHNERDGVSNHQPHDCLLNAGFIQAPIEENIKAPRH